MFLQTDIMQKIRFDFLWSVQIKKLIKPGAIVYHYVLFFPIYLQWYILFSKISKVPGLYKKSERKVDKILENQFYQLWYGLKFSRTSYKWKKVSENLLHIRNLLFSYRSLCLYRHVRK